MDKIKILALGGLDEDGKNLYVIEINNDIFVFNAGFKYPNKHTPGIDFIIANFNYLIENKDRIKGYILPKAKKNSFGALPYIYKHCPAPIYCTSLTKKYLLEFATHYHQESDFEFNLINLPSTIKINNHEFIFFSTCASMPLTFGFCLRTSLGNVVYSGDFIVEYSNEKFFKLDLNTVGKIAEESTLILMNESRNSSVKGYCSPNHRLYPFFEKSFNDAQGRCFVGLSSDNLYHLNEFFKACNDFNRQVCFYDEDTKKLYDLNKTGEQYFPNITISPLSEVLRIKGKELVILITGEDEELYDKISLLANNENEAKHVRLTPNDTFILASTPSDNTEMIATSTIDEVYKTGCNVKYIQKKMLQKMHACEEDLKMLISLLKPKYYFPIEGYYVNLLDNAKIAFGMGLNLSHNNIFLLDNGQTIELTKDSCNIDFSNKLKVETGDVMIDGIGVGDVVNEIIIDRTKLSEDGVIIFGSAISKSQRKIICGPDLQMRGFLFLKDKDADNLLKELLNMYVENIEKWLETTDNFDNLEIENKIKELIYRHLKKTLNREPVIKPNIIVLD